MTKIMSKLCLTTWLKLVTIEQNLWISLFNNIWTLENTVSSYITYV